MFEVIEQEMMCPYHEGDLFGILYRPKTDTEKLPCVILSHGIYSSHQMTAPSAMELAKLGYACYCFDFRGCSYSRKSGGDLQNCSVLTEADELCAVVDWMREQDFADPARVYLLGQSMGGLVSVLAGARKQDVLAGMILMYPAMHIADTFNAMFPDRSAIPDVTENFLGIPGLNLGRIFFTDALKAPIAQSVSDFTKPVYIIHGTEDKLVPVSYGEKAAKEFQQAAFVSVSGGEHGFNLNAEQAAHINAFLLGD